MHAGDAEARCGQKELLLIFKQRAFAPSSGFSTKQFDASSIDSLRFEGGSINKHCATDADRILQLQICLNVEQTSLDPFCC